MTDAATLVRPSLTETSDEPLITIAIPTFNRASLLKQCVGSALAQTYRRFEVLVSDNASTDMTQEVLRQFDDRRLRSLRHKENVGPLANWNFCLAEARTEYVVFVSDDDTIAPHMLERMMALVEREPHIPAVFTLCDVYESARATTWPTPPCKTLGTGICKGTDLLVEYLKGNIFAVMCSILLRTEELRAVGGFRADIPYAGDMAAWAAILLKGRAGFVNESCAVFCLHQNAQTYALRIDEHIDDERRMIAAIDAAADRVVADPGERRQVKLFARRYFARRIVDILFSHRERGASLVELLPTIWRHRRHLSHLGASYAVRLARPITLIVLPTAAVEWVRSLKRVGRTMSGKVVFGQKL